METQKEEAKRIILNGKPTLEDFTDFRDYIDASIKYDESLDYYVSEIFNLNECKRVLKMSDKVCELDDEEETYEETYYAERDKARKMLESGILKRENKIKALEKEIEELSRMHFDLKHSDFSCLRIHYRFEVMDKVKKEVEEK